MNPDDYCQDKAAPAGSSLYYSLLSLPEDKRRAVTALAAFRREVQEVPVECQDPGVARTKLQWWRDEVRRLSDGQPRHPVTQALAGAAPEHGPAREHLGEVIDGVDADVDQFSYPTFQDLSLYCHRVAAMTCLMTAELLGINDRRTLRYAHDLGTALQLTRIIRDVRRDGTRGRVYLPLDELREYGVSPEDLMAGRGSDNAGRLMEYQVRRAREYYDSALEKLPETDRFGQTSGIVLIELRRAVLREIEDDGYRVWDRRVSLTPVRKLWIAWRTERRERARMKRARP